jgi:site-specific DNA-methyltransferase (adenine-specific)
MQTLTERRGGNMINSIISNIEKHIEKTIPEIANYGEVFTKIETVNDMIDLLPDDFWKNPDLKILDPCNGVGNFPSVVIKKLMEGLIEFRKNEDDRYKHIVENMIYVCEIQPRNISHYLKLFNINNKYQLNYYEGSFLGGGFNNHMRNIWGINNFNLVLGNPPYQVGSDSRSAVSIYHKFVEKSVSMSHFVLMITPSKWYSNPSMSNFRENMIKNYGLKILKDVKEKNFSNVEIKGGVSYFLIEKGYKDKCLYNNLYRKFNYNIITNENVDTLLEKLKEYDTFSKYLNSDQYFGIRNIDKNFLSERNTNCVKCFVSKKNGDIKYIEKNKLRIKPNYNKYKVFLPIASGSKHEIGTLGRIIIGEPTDICSRTFVHFSFETLDECKSFVSYLNTDIIKKLISLRKQTQLVKKDCFSFVPIVPLDKIWNNEDVLKYLNLNL